jgi:hypothetical protein
VWASVGVGLVCVGVDLGNGVRSGAFFNLHQFFQFFHSHLNLLYCVGTAHTRERA